MATKDRTVRRVDEVNPNIVKGGGQLIQTGLAPVATPAFPSAPPPENVVVASGQALLRTTYTPKVLVAVSWEPPINLLPEIYSIEAAEDVNFQSNLQRWTTTVTSGVIELKPNDDYWIRVQAIVRGVYSEYGYPDNYPVASIHTIQDTTPPGPVTGAVTNWSTGDLRFNWTNPSSDNFFQTRIRIYDTFGGTLYVEDYIVGNPGSISHYVFTVAMNNRVTGNNPLTSVYYELLAYSIGGTPATTSVTGTVTKSAPTVPTGLTSTWASDDGTFDEGVTFTWNAVTGASSYRVLIDGIGRETPFPQYTYPYTENVANHRPTLVSGDHTLSITVQARDPLNQLSGGASGTATNLAPTSSNLTLSYVPGFSSLFAQVTPTAEIKDLYGYRWTLKSGGVNVSTVLTFTPEAVFSSLSGIYSLELYAIDLFGRKSATISGVNIVLDGLTIEQLRANVTYTNFGAISFDADKLKDGLVTQAAVFNLGTSWKWIKAQRALLDRYRTISLHCFTASGTTRGYFGTSLDDETYRWFAGPLTGTYSNTLTEHASETIAQASGILISSHPLINRYDLPEILEARYIKVGHRDLSTTYSINEFYPRRLVQSDDIEAETIRAINIAAQTITADKIQVFSLAASNATISGVITIATTGGIWQGTGTFASPTTGLKMWNNAGIGRFTTYSGGTVQVDFDSIGRLTAGGGKVLLDQVGVTISGAALTYDLFSVSPQITPRGAAIQWNNPNGSEESARILGNADGQVQVIGEGIVVAVPLSNQEAYGLQVRNNGAVSIVASTFTVNPTGGTESALTIVTDSLDETLSTLTFEGTVNVRTALNVTDGLTTLTLTDSSTNTASQALAIRHNTTGTPAANFGSQVIFYGESTGGNENQLQAQVVSRWVDATHATRQAELVLFVHDSAAARTALTGRANGAAAEIGFLGATPAIRQTGGAATADLTYSANERDMLNAAYGALRTFGLLT